MAHMHSKSMPTLTALLVLAGACMPGMHAQFTGGAGASATAAGAPPGCPDKNRDAVSGGFTSAADCELNECDECGECSISGTTFLCPLPEELPAVPPVELPAPVPVPAAPEFAPSPLLLEPQDDADFYIYDQYEYADAPESFIEGPVTGAFPRGLGPSAAPGAAPGMAPAAAPFPAAGPVGAEEECGALGEECCADDLSCEPGLACDFFQSLTATECVMCGGVGEICCFGDDLEFGCNGGLVCDFRSAELGPTCMTATDKSVKIPTGPANEPRRPRQHTGIARRIVRPE